MCDFRDAKVGDKVWSVGYGWGKIELRDDLDSNWPLFVKFSHRGTWYSNAGVGLQETESTLFWDEVKIIPPPKPKRKVKMAIEFDIDIHLNQFKRPFIKIVGLNPDPLTAITYPTTERLGEAHHVRHEYEVEE